MPFAGGTRRNPLAELLALSQEPEVQAQPVRPQKSKKKPRTDPFAQAAPPPVPEPVDEPMGMRDYAALGVRGLGGLFGIGAAPGAAFGAGSEAIANLIEGDSLLDPETMKEIGAAGVIGASGGGIAKMVGAGAGALQALLRGGALSGGAEAASEYIRGEEIDPGRIATSAALGGGAAGATSALLKRLGITTPPGVKPGPAKPTFEVEQTPSFSTGKKGKIDKSELGTGPLKRTLFGEGTPSHRPPTSTRPVSGQEYDDIYARWRHLTDKEMANTLTGDELVEAQSLNKIVRGLNFERPADIAQASRVATPDAGGLSPRAAKAVTVAERETARLADEAAAQARIDDALGMGMEPQAPTVSESVSVGIPGGKQRLTQKYAMPEEADELAEIVPPAPTRRQPDINPVTGNERVNAVEMQRLTGVPPKVASPLQDLLGVAERRADRNPELDEFFRAERQSAELPDLPKERRVNPRTPEEDRYYNTLRSGGTEEDAVLARQGIGAPIAELRAKAAPPNPEAEAAAARTAAMMAEAPPSPLDELLGVTPTAPVGAQTTVPLAAVGRSPGQVAGAHYRELNRVFGQGESGLPPEAAKIAERTGRNRVAGQAASRLAKEEGIPPGAPPVVEAPVAAQATPEAPPSVAPQAAAQPKARFGANASESLRKFFMEQEGRGPRGPLGPTGFGSRAGGETGSIDPALAASLGLGLAGALGGAAWDPLENRMLSAVVGGAAGAAIPQLASKIASISPAIQGRVDVPPEAQNLVSQLSTPEGAAGGVMDIIRLLPQIQRGMLLTNQNIFNNAIAAPYGSAISFGLERGLAGDARGWEVLRLMRPDIFADNFKNSWDEAAHLIGDSERAGGPLVGAAGTYVEKGAALPGTFMAAGDLSARKAIMAAGFTEQEARMATLTAEPETRFGKAIVNMQRTGGPLAQMALPFARTIVNLGEQATRRLPGVGYIAQGMRETADPIGVQHIQQLLGGGSLVGGYAAGQNLDSMAESIDVPFLPDDPASNARLLRSFLSNITGPNATLAMMGLAAGRAADQGKAPMQQLGAGIKTGIQEAPLPTTAPFEDVSDFLTSEPGQRRLPRSMVPGIVRDELNELLFGTGAQAQGGRRKTRRSSERKER